MHLLQPALYAEGRNDYDLLQPLLSRLCNELCAGGDSAVDVAPMLALDDLRDPQPLRLRADRIVRSAVAARASWNLLFIHSDADGDRELARRERIQPAIAGLVGCLSDALAIVAVVPVRSTDAWALADGDALREAFGVTLGDQDLGLPSRPQDVERILDPKSALHETFLATRPTRKRARRGAAPYLGSIGEALSLKRLRQVPGFAVLYDDVLTALRLLRIRSG